MFEDLQEEHVDVTPDSPDRTIAWAIWSRADESVLTPDEAWHILHERYPDDPRFLLLNAYTELSETRRQSERAVKVAAVVGSKVEAKAEVGGWTPSYFLQKLERVVAAAAEPLHPPIRDVLAFGSSVITGAKGPEAELLGKLRRSVGVEAEVDPSRDERDRARIRLRRFEREVVKELEERTRDNQPLGVRAAAPAAAADDWATAVGDPSKPRRRYSPPERFGKGEIVEHPKFGAGLVTGTEPGKVVIVFESGTRKLLCGA